METLEQTIRANLKLLANTYKISDRDKKQRINTHAREYLDLILENQEDIKDRLYTAYLVMAHY
jgi:hypothetical protein